VLSIYLVRKFCFLLILPIACLLLWQCAQPYSPQGGPKDEDPPELDVTTSTPNEQTKFEKKNIYLNFNEFIEVKNAATKVLISPPMTKNPRIYTRGKQLRIEFPEDEVLKNEATYVINFGDAIQDFTESNKVKNYRFIFSTGDFIDSLVLEGKVIDAFTGSPVEEALVMLYDQHQDSVVYAEKPFYFSSTDADGAFKIENIRNDTFKVFVLKDENINYLYDLPTEPIGFLDSLVHIQDSTTQELSLQIFTPIPKLELLEYNAKTYGVVELLFTKPPDSIEVSSDLALGDFFKEIKGDSILYWYNLDRDTSFQIFLTDKVDFYDTIKVRKQLKEDLLEDEELKFLGTNLTKENILSPASKPTIRFNLPSKISDLSKIKIGKLLSDFDTRDSLSDTISYTIIQDSIALKTFQFQGNFIQDSMYYIEIDSGAITSIYEHPLDSLSVNFKMGSALDFGKITIDYDSINIDKPLILHLFQEQKLIDKKLITDIKGTIEYPLMKPGNYELELIQDDNKNGIWDPGNYKEKKQSEKIKRTTLNELKENWELRQKIKGFAFDTSIPEN